MSGVGMMLKAFGIEIDPAEVQAMGKQAGELVVEFRERLTRIENNMSLVLQQLEKINGQLEHRYGIDTPAENAEIESKESQDGESETHQNGARQ